MRDDVWSNRDPQSRILAVTHSPSQLSVIEVIGCKLRICFSNWIDFKTLNPSQLQEVCNWSTFQISALLESLQTQLHKYQIQDIIVSFTATRSLPSEQTQPQPFIILEPTPTRPINCCIWRCATFYHDQIPSCSPAQSCIFIQL